MGFEIGQRVKVISVDPELGGDSHLNCSGILIEVECPDRVGLSHHVRFDNGIDYWYLESNLELVPDNGKQPDATLPQVYPPLRVMLTDNKPSQTWQQVLGGYPLAASQPHLFLAGYYRSDIYDLERFAKDTPHFILMSTIACSNAAIGGSETQPYHIVFVITEGE